MPRDRYPSAPAVVVAFCADSIEADARHNIANLCPLIIVFLLLHKDSANRVQSIQAFLRMLCRDAAYFIHWDNKDIEENAK